MHAKLLCQMDQQWIELKGCARSIEPLHRKHMEYDGMSVGVVNQDGKHQWYLMMESMSKLKKEEKTIMSKALAPWKSMIVCVQFKGICKKCKWSRLGQGGLVVGCRVWNVQYISILSKKWICMLLITYPYDGSWNAWIIVFDLVHDGWLATVKTFWTFCIFSFVYFGPLLGWKNLVCWCHRDSKKVLSNVSK